MGEPTEIYDLRVEVHNMLIWLAQRQKFLVSRTLSQWGGCGSQSSRSSSKGRSVTSFWSLQIELIYASFYMCCLHIPTKPAKCSVKCFPLHRQTSIKVKGSPLKCSLPFVTSAEASLSHSLAKCLDAPIVFSEWNLSYSSYRAMFCLECIQSRSLMKHSALLCPEL